MATTVLNVLPHRGGGAETFIDCLEPLAGYRQERRALSATRSAAGAALTIPLRFPGTALAARRAGIVQTHGDVAAILSLPLLRSGRSVAVMQGLHMLRRAQGTRGQAVRAGLRRVVAAAGCVVCSSEAERADLLAVADQRDAGRLVVVDNTIPDARRADPARRAAIRATLDLPEGRLAVLYAGRLEARKDPLTVVTAARRARAEGHDVVLLVAGEGPLAGAVADAAGDAVRPLGFRDDVPDLLAAADVFAMPSEREGQSFAVVEAMAAGLPLVVSDGAGNPEAVGDAGIVVARGDVAAFTDAFATLAGDRAERARRAAASRERFAARHAPEAFEARMAAIYAQVLAA